MHLCDYTAIRVLATVSHGYGQPYRLTSRRGQYRSTGCPAPFIPGYGFDMRQNPFDGVASILKECRASGTQSLPKLAIRPQDEIHAIAGSRCHLKAGRSAETVPNG